ncbi:MAG: DUF1566 domain-containing protein [Burkholderiaceae bacterium]
MIAIALAACGVGGSVSSCGGPCVPTAAALADLIAIVGERARFDASASTSPDGGPLTYTWTIRREQSDMPYRVPPIFDVTTESGSVLDFLIPRAGSWQVTLKVTDSAGISSESSAHLFGRYQFQVNGNGTISNLQTSLVWQQQDDGNQYTLAEARGVPVLSAGDNNGLNVCGDLVWAGFNDWRVPTLLEVQSLYDYSRAVLPIATVFAATTRAQSFYLSDSWIPNSKADYIYTSDGLIYHQDAIDREYLRCVRS